MTTLLRYRNAAEQKPKNFPWCLLHYSFYGGNIEEYLNETSIRLWKRIHITLYLAD